jgi:hypothetical protein
MTPKSIAPTIDSPDAIDTGLRKFEIWDTSAFLCTTLPLAVTASIEKNPGVIHGRVDESTLIAVAEMFCRTQCSVTLSPFISA